MEKDWVVVGGRIRECNGRYERKRERRRNTNRQRMKEESFTIEKRSQ